MGEETVVPHWALVLRALVLLAVGASMFEAHYELPDQLGLLLLLVLSDCVAGLARLPDLTHVRLWVRLVPAGVWLLSVFGVVGGLALLDQGLIVPAALGWPLIAWTVLLGLTAVAMWRMDRHPTYRWLVLEWAALWFAVSGLLAHGHLRDLPTGPMLAWTASILGASSLTLMIRRSWHRSREVSGSA